MPQLASDGSKESLEEELNRLYKILGIKREQLEGTEAKIDKGREAVVEKYTPQPEINRHYNPAAPGPQGVMKHLIASYESLALKLEKDVDDIVKEEMDGKNPYLVMLKNVLTGYGNPQARSVREKLLEREMVKRQMQIQRMNSIRSTLSTFGALDVQAGQTAVDHGKIAAGIEGKGLAAKVTKQQSELENVQKMFSGAQAKKLEHASSVEQEEIKSKRDFEEAKELARLQGVRAESLAKINRRIQSSSAYHNALPTGRTHPSGPIVQESVIHTAPDGTITRQVMEGGRTWAKETPENVKQRIFGQSFVDGVARTGALFNSILAADPHTGTPTRLKLLGMLRPLVAASKLSGFDLTKHIDGLELGSVEGAFIREFHDNVISKVRITSGQQVSIEERKYIELTLASLFDSNETFGIGMQMTRLLAGLTLARASDGIIGADGKTPLTHEAYPGGPLAYNDYTPQFMLLLSIAERMESRELGAGAKWLEGIDGTKPWEYSDLIDKIPGAEKIKSELDEIYK